MKSWDPFADLLAIQDRMNDLFERLLAAPPAAGSEAEEAGCWRPVAEVVRSPQGLEITCELPGLGPNDVEVHAEGTALVIAGRRPRADGGGASYHLVERPSGHFLRRFELPDDLDVTGLETSLSEGLLRVRIPRRAAVSAR